MTDNKKMTKRDCYNVLLGIEEVKRNEALTKFIEHELELLEKKNSTERKPTAVQQANESIKDAILNGMEKDKSYTITELIKAIPELNELTNQRVSALVRQLVEAELIVRTEDKRKAYFKLA